MEDGTSNYNHWRKGHKAAIATGQQHSRVSHLTVPDTAQLPSLSRILLQIQNGSHRADHLLQLRVFSGGLNVPNISTAPTQNLHFNSESLSPPAPTRQQETRCSHSIRVQAIPFGFLQNGNFNFANFVFILKVLLITGLDSRLFLRSQTQKQTK